MSEKPTIEQLLRQWVRLKKQGEEPNIEELCRDCPQLADELRERIAQLQTDDEGVLQDTEAVQTSSAQSHTTAGKARIQISGYTILREIGHGGQGAIFKALQHSTGRHVAVKILSETRQLSDIERARFEREAQVLAALAHPHIVSIIDRGHTAGGSAYFTMEYIEGQPLDRWLDEYRRDHPPADIPSNPGELLRLFMKIADAVNVAHLRGIIHRDLKPSNILVDDKGNPHILDFGLARLGLPAEVYSEQHRIVTMTGQFIGTLPWVSPEQAEGLTSKIDTRTDVYSLGVILYEMLTAEFPYEVVGNMRDVLDNILRAQPKPPSTVIEARLAKQAQRRRRWRKTPQNPITPNLEAIVLKALNKKPEDRYQNAGELARDIGNYLSGRPLEARGLTRVAARRYGPWIAVAAAAVLFLSGLLAGGAWQILSRGPRLSRVRTAPETPPAPNPSRTLHAVIEFIDRQTGKVRITGADTAPAEGGFTWDWGDGTVHKGFFAQEHTYRDPSKNYTAKVTSHYANGRTDSVEVPVDFEPPLQVQVLSMDPQTGQAIVDGMDARNPGVPFTFDWGDGVVNEGWLPHKHVYANKSRNYTVRITSHLPDGSADSAEIQVNLADPGTRHIPDPNLRAVVKDALGLKDRDPTPADMLSLTALNASGKGIRDLTGLEYAAKLKHLDLSENQINRIAPLDGLAELEELSLADNRIADLGPLAGLTRLKSLNLARNRGIADITPLSALNHLVTLNLYDNQVRDVSVLAGLSRLRSLDLAGNDVTGLEPLANLTDLTFLHLAGNHLTDIRSLAGLANLTELNVEDNNIVDIAPLVELNKLVHLLVRGNPLGAAAYSVTIPELRSKNPTIDVAHDTPDGEGKAAVSPTDTFTVVDPSPLVEGVGSVWASGDSGPLAALRPAVVPVVTGDEDTSVPSLVVAATGFGQGRVVASSLSNFPDNETLDQYADSKRLALNIVDWLDQRRTKRVLVTTGHQEWGGGDNFSSLQAALQEKGYSFLRWDRPLFPGALADIGVVIVGTAWAPFTTEEIATLNAFVRDGGGLFLQGLGWSWPPAHPGLTLDDYPMNKLGADYGVRWIDRCVTDPTNQRYDRPVFHCLYPNTLKQPSYAELAQRVEIPDERLKVAIQEALGLQGKQDLTREDLLHLVSLGAPDRSIADLTGLECAPNVAELWLAKNHIVHLGALVGLSRLRKLDFTENAIRDVTPLARLPHLRELYLGYNQIEDISSLAGLTNLEYLALQENAVRNISSLSGLVHLTRLQLSSNQIRDFSPLSGLIEMEELNLGRNRCGDMGSLAAMTRLHRLEAEADQISDLRPLRDLTQLTALNLSSNQIDDLQPLANLTDLEDLDLAGNQIRDISILARMTKLTHLHLWSNQIEDLSPLRDLTNLTWLGVGHNRDVREVQSLASLINLTFLAAEINQIADIAPLAGLPKLETLRLGFANITDIRALADLHELQELQLQDNHIQDIAPLTGLRRLTKLDVQKNPLAPAAYTTAIPQIRANNPNIDLLCDAPQGN